jgi:sugar/nucleoside kinase (ribokinase family)
VLYLAVRKANMTINSDIYERFIKIAKKKGIRVSTCVNARMKEFVEQEDAADLKK